MVSIVFTLSGDLVAHRAQLGLKSRLCDKDHICNYCTISKKELVDEEGHHVDGRWWRKVEGPDGQSYLTYTGHKSNGVTHQLRSYQRSCWLARLQS